MSRIIVLLALFFGAVSLFMIPASAEESMMFSINSLAEFEIGQYPFIYGKITDYQGNPVSDVEIQANFPSRVIMTVTDSAGEFSVTSPIAAESGQYTVTVFATKDKMFADNQITYQVKEKQQLATSPYVPKEAAKSVKNIPQANNDDLKQDPLSRMILQQIKEQNANDEKQKAMTEEQQHIKKQRLQAQANVQKDLELSEKQHESHSPRNAFLRFLADIDYSVKNIFWQQFLFTEKLVNNAQESKQNALEEGKSSVEAMQVFQREAAVTQKELVEHNKNLSIKYGNATASVQEKFDEKGKLPREK